MSLFLYLLKDYLLAARWLLQGCPVCLPPILKRRFLVKHAPADYDWIETGTYRGLTTCYLAQEFPRSRIVSIEPSQLFHERAKAALSSHSNITLLHGDSADILDKAIALVGDKVAFFLDGHYSGGDTFKGHNACPIPAELQHIKNHTVHKNVIIFIDDARLLHQSGKTGYPSPQSIIEWADENHYRVEEKNDVFILRKQNTH